MITNPCHQTLSSFSLSAETYRNALINVLWVKVKALLFKKIKIYMTGCKFTSPGQPNINMAMEKLVRLWYAHRCPFLCWFQTVREHSWEKCKGRDLCEACWKKGRMPRPLLENDRHWATWSCEGGHNLDTYNASIVPRQFVHSRHTQALSVHFLKL